MEENILGTQSIGKLLAKFSIPGIISMVVNSIYNIVDQVFIGQGVGYLGNGATNVIFPLSTLAMAFFLMTGDGTASFMSLKLGAGKEEDAARGAVAGMLSALLEGIFLGAVYLIFLTPLCRLFGATDAIMPYAKQYGMVIAIGMPFCALCCGFSSIIRADGSPRWNMIGLLTGCAFNLVFDPVFIFICHWGVTGAAVATIMGQCANAILNIIYIGRFKTVRLKKKYIRNCMGLLPQICRLGISSFLQQIVVVLSMAVQNNVLRIYGARSVYGAEIPLTALGVTMKIFNIMMAICIGLAGGAQPIWGYNYGAGKYDRVRKTFRYVAVLATAVMTVGFLFFQIIPGPIVSIFGTDSELYTEYSIKCLRIFLLFMPLEGITMIAGIFFQAVGRPVQSSLNSLAKQLFFMIPAMLILAPIIGVDGGLWAGPVSDFFACILTVTLLVTSWKKIFAVEKSRLKQKS